MIFIIHIVKLILNFIYCIIKLFPIEDKVTIASRQSSSPTLDIRMLAAEIEKQSPSTKVVCLCKKMEDGIGSKIGYGFHLLRQMWHIGTSKAVVVDSYCIGVSLLKQRKSLKVVQMWHALGALKKFGKSIAGNGGEGRNEKLAKAMNMHKNYTHILISSGRCREPYKEAFGYDDAHMKVGSLPRVDAILDIDFREQTLKKIDDIYPELVSRKGSKKNVIYAPTFRKNMDFGPKLTELAKAFDNKAYNLVIKKHPLMEVSSEIKGTIVDNRFSTIEMMFAADYVICDYSAVVYEAALLVKPLVFYAFDFEAYCGSRDFYLDYLKDIPGEVVYSAEEVANIIETDEFDIRKIKNFAKEYVTITENCTSYLARFILKSD